MNVRTRIAPSPTGDPHVGTAYVALVNYLFAKQHGGEFVLRIEDTDRNRSTAASENVILEALRWIGLAWDEGPDVGGSYGPYRQSDRLDVYEKYAHVLLENGDAFKCFCTSERLDEMRREQRLRSVPPAYDGRCLTLSPADVAANEAARLPFVVRLRVPREGSATIDDLLRGPIVFDWSAVDMQVLVKSDGWPTYHLANVVDDHLMEITHVMRGEEWLSSAPKHLLLYRAFGWEMPQIAHLPLLRNADRSKLSKRKNPTSILFYKRLGYLPQALLNFLGLFCVPPNDGEEMMDLGTMVARFGLAHISLGGPVFDVAKLDWLSARYIRETLSVPQLVQSVRDWSFDESYLEAIAGLAQKRIERLSDLGPLTAFFFAGRLNVTVDSFAGGKLDSDATRKLFVLVLAALDLLPAWELGPIEAAVRRVVEISGTKLRDAVRPLYVAVTGSPQSVPLFDSMALLGRDLVRERLRFALEVLGGATNAESDAWRKLLAVPTGEANGSVA
ncbi:MAG: glutamate--tRNA ligase [Candidatus Eremiobacteraeota bacterium]|nr:glutamate--tRNA ligase [Candidatus Eremiobacteraeota bacterium]